MDTTQNATNSSPNSGPTGTLVDTGQEVPFSFPSVNPLNPVNLILFVPGTTDPINTNINAVSDSYIYYVDNQHVSSGFYDGVAAIKEELETQFPPTEYPDLIVIDSKNSIWSGKNNKEERDKGAIQLVKVLDQHYSKWETREVFIHLIGHSHGGNVINEFTKRIKNSPDFKFPELWKIKSIVYLSVPFFTKEHQLDESNFHTDARIFNIHNDYDITQRVIADHSLTELSQKVEDLKNDQLIKSALKRLSDNNTLNRFIDSYKLLDADQITPQQAKIFWQDAISVFTSFEEIMTYAKQFISGYNSVVLNNLKSILREISLWIQNILNDLNVDLSKIEREINGDDPFWHIDDNIPFINQWRWILYFVKSLNLSSDVIKWLNTIFYTEEGNPDSSYILRMLEDLLVGPDGILLDADDTKIDPIDQLSTDSLIKYDSGSITSEDPYNLKYNYNTRYNLFIDKLESEISKGLNTNNKLQGNFKSILLVLLAQFQDYDDNKLFKKFIEILKTTDFWINILSNNAIGLILELTLEIDDELKDLLKNAQALYNLINDNNYNLVDPNDIRDPNIPFIEKPGSIGYLALKSHNLSRTLMTNSVSFFLEGIMQKPEEENVT